MIAESVAQQIKGTSSQYEETFALIFAGLSDEHPRVRYNALTFLGLILNKTSPESQNRYHEKLVAVILKMMAQEDLIKMKAQVMSAACSFVAGFLPEDAEPTPQQRKEAKEKFVSPQYGYAQKFVEQINILFTLAIEKQYEPLQEETLTLLNTLAELLQEDFAQYYNSFMPGMKQMLSVPATTAEQQNLRTNLITTIGCIIESVKDKPE